MKKKISIVLFVFGGIMFSLFFVTYLMGFKGLGAWTGMGVALFLIGWGYVLLKDKKVPKWISITVRLLVGFILALAIIITGFMATGFTQSKTLSDTLIVLGCGVDENGPSRPMRERLSTAYAYMEEHPESIAVLTGGQGSDEKVSEAEAMKQWMVQKGIAEERLLLENQSTSTRENFAFSKELLIEHNLPLDVTVVTNEFHEYRAASVAKANGFTVSVLPAKSIWYAFPTHYVRELYGILAYWLNVA